MGEKNSGPKVPVSIRDIVHQDDEASRTLAQLCREVLQSEHGAILSREPIAAKDLGVGDVHLESDKGLLVVAAVIGRGSQALSISRDLRDLHKTGARTYLIGAQVTEFFAQIDSLQSNLKFSSTEANIQVEVYRKLAIGSSAAGSFDLERRWLLANQEKLPQTLADRLEQLRQLNIPTAAELFCLPGRTWTANWNFARTLHTGTIVDTRRARTTRLRSLPRRVRCCRMLVRVQR